MQTEEEFMVEFDRAHKEYMELRAAKGFPFGKPDKNKPLPSWVLRAGERPAMTFVTPAVRPTARPAKSIQTPPTPVQPTDMPNSAPTTPVVKTAAGKGMSKAEQVRTMIRDAMATNKTIDDVIARAKSELGMGNAQAKTYVTENWTRVAKG